MNPPSIKRAARPPARHCESSHANHTELIASERESANGGQDEPGMQRLTLVLEGITASDYLAWVRDPDPHLLGRELRSVSVQADALGDLIEVLLHWNTDPPAPQAAAPAAGFFLTPEVTELRASQ